MLKWEPQHCDCVVFWRETLYSHNGSTRQEYNLMAETVIDTKEKLEEGGLIIVMYWEE